MPEEMITMTQKAIDRVSVMQRVASKELRQKEAADQLRLSVRQVKRLLARFRSEGAAGLVSGHQGRRPGNAISEDVHQEVMALIRSRYADFGPTLACEKLAACHDHHLSAETLRQWMIADGLWRAKQRKGVRVHQRRARRPCRGELIQIDGSPHDWFEDRGPRCTLIVFIDDATSELMALRMVPAESTQAYMETLRDYLQEHGRPVAIYSDKHSIFRVNNPEHEGELTQFSRLLKTLDIEPIHANTPQAKGRVERANQTLQDRLVKELRLADISDMASANAFLPEFIAQHNQRFAVAPQNSTDAHRAVLHNEQEIDQMFRIHHTRKLSKNLTIQYQNKEYQLTGQGKGYRLRGAQITVCEGFDKSVLLLHQGKNLPYRLFSKGQRPISMADEKTLQKKVDQTKRNQLKRPANKPKPDHPWKRRSYLIQQDRL